MFGIDWSELVIIAVVVIIVIGPKDLPKVMRSLGKATSKMRATASEFRQQFDEAMKEAELDDVKSTLNDMRKLNPRHHLTKVLDPFREVAHDVKQSLAQTNDALQGISSPSLQDQEILGNPHAMSTHAMSTYDADHDAYLMRVHAMGTTTRDKNFYLHKNFDATHHGKLKKVKHHTSFELKRPLRQHCLKHNGARFSYNSHGRKAAHYGARLKKRHMFDGAIQYNVNGAKKSDE